MKKYTCKICKATFEVEDGVIDGGIVVFASGNESSGMSAFPGAYSKCLAVSAIAPDFTPASYSNFGVEVDFICNHNSISSAYSYNTDTGIRSTCCNCCNCICLHILPFLFQRRCHTTTPHKMKFKK